MTTKESQITFFSLRHLFCSYYEVVLSCSKHKILEIKMVELPSGGGKK